MANWAKAALGFTSKQYEGKWLCGLLTNHKIIRTSKKFKKFAQSLGYKRLPTLLMTLNTTKFEWPTKEAVLLKLPSMSILDGDTTQPFLATYNVAGNNTSWGALNFYLRLIRAAITRGGYLERKNLVTLS